MERQAETGRPLGPKEQLLHGLHRWGALIPVQVLHIVGDLDPLSVRNALDHVQQRYPLLRSHIVYGSRTLLGDFPYLVRPPIYRVDGTQAIPLTVEPSPGQNWQSVVEQELLTPIPAGTHPRVRATMVRERSSAAKSALILTFDHAIVDARAVNLISRDLMRILEADAANIPNPPQRNMPPAVESRLIEKPRATSAPYFGPIRLPTNQCRRISQRQTRVHLKRLSRAHTAVLHQACKNNKATLHGAVCSAALKTLSQVFSMTEMTCLSTVDLRRLCTPRVPDEEIGCYVDIVRTKHRVASDFWSLARDVSFTLIARLATSREGSSALKIPPLGRLLREGLGAVWNSGRTDALAVSTMGDTGLEREYGDLTLAQVTMAVSLHVRGPSMFILAYEHDGELNLSFCYTAPVMSDETAAVIAGRTMELLEGVG